MNYIVHTFPSAYIMLASSAEGEGAKEAVLASSNMMLYEGDTKCLSFWYILENEGIREEGHMDTLTIITHDTEDRVHEMWTSKK